MSITYNSTTKTITVSGETNCNFEALYQASVAGGWGVIQKPSTETYRIQVQLSITNSSTFVETNKIIYLDVIDLNTTSPLNIVVDTTSKLTLGALDSTTYKTGKDGCIIYLPNFVAPPSYPTLSYQRIYIYGNGNAIISFYGTAIISGTGRPCYIGSQTGGVTNKYIFWSCYLKDRFNRITLFNWFNLSNDMSNTLCDNVWLENGSIPLYRNIFLNTNIIVFMGDSHIARECTFVNNSKAGQFYTRIHSTSKFIDCVGVAFNNIGVQNNSDCGILEQYSVAPTILNVDKTPIVNANLKLYDKNNTLIFDVNTNSSGTITPIDVTIGEYRGDGATNTLIRTYYNPFTLVVSKDGYETYTSTFDLTEKYRSIITLTPPEYIYIDKITVVDQLTTKIKNESIIANIMEEQIYTKIINEV